MSNIIIHRIKLLLISFIAIIILFLTLVALQKDTILIVTMSSSDKTILHPQIYFTDKKFKYSEQYSRRAYKIKDNQYFFSLPKSNTIQHIRFDPARKKSTITIENITVITQSWFTKTRYYLPLEVLIHNQQITHYKQSKTSITFSTIGNDPQLDGIFSIKKISTSKNFHLKLLFMLPLIWMTVLYLYFIYKTKVLSEALITKLILYSLFLAFTLFKVDYYKDHIKPFYPPDELAHLAYIDYIHHHHDILPKFKNMRMLNNIDAGNYLSHPPLFYHIMNTNYDENLPIYQNVTNFREMNMIIFMASFLLLLYLGFSSKISILSHFVYLTFISSIPMYAYSGGSITNDNLAVLGAIIFILGFKKLIEKDYSTLTFFIIGLGIFIAYFSKLTAALLIFFTLVFFIFYAIKTKEKIKINAKQIILLLLFTLPILYYQFYIMSTYHSLVPTFNVTYPEQYKHSPFFILEQNRVHLSPWEWLERMQEYIAGGWFGIHSHHSFIKNSVYEYLGLLSLHIIAIITLFFKCNDKDLKSYCFVGKLGLLALFAVLIIQYLFSYKTHLNSGYMGGLQPRYLLPFMFSFAIMASIFVERYKKIFIFNIFIIILCTHAIYSDFFYFLNYYS